MATDWPRDAFALATAAVAVFHGVRLVVSVSRRSPGEVALDLTHAAMGAAMTVMLVGRWSAGAALAGAALSGLAFAGFAGCALRRRAANAPSQLAHWAWQAVLAAAMAFMLAETALVDTGPSHGPGMPDMVGMAGMEMAHGDGSGVSRLVAVLLAVAVTIAAVGFTRIVWRPGRAHRVAPIAPTATACCQVAMSVATVYMLGAMI